MTMEPTMEPTTAPGWYRVDVQTERWWDGSAWGPQVRPVALPMPQVPSKSVTYSPRRTSHAFHLIMTLLTGGIWGIFVWLPMTVLNKMSRQKSVTRYR